MEYRPFGRTGVRVSALGLGCWMFGDRADEAESARIIDQALDLGINFFDTANNYGGAPGRSESIVGAALEKSSKRDRVVINTKAYMPVDADDVNGWGVSRRHLIQQCEASLRRLRTDHVDVFTLHRFDPDVPVDETLRALDDLVRAGKVRYLGVSTSAAWEVVESLWVAKEFGLNRIVAETPPYNLLDRRVERELMPMAATFGLAVNPWAPLGGGVLTGQYQRGTPPPDGSRYGGGGVLAGFAGDRFSDAVFDVLDVLTEMAGQRGVTVAQLAFSWVVRQPGVTSVLCGPERLADLTSCAESLAITWDAESLAALDAVAPPGDKVASWYDPLTGPRFRPHPHRL
ncbi:aldo/keto reductase [Dactylosporangium sp. NPDC050688]|uniref:aldo/keto reductase n=1 Tax=Dactylosporangium sp. NPDC050688 TaxID=3157217 RepID=UPI0033E360A3